MTVIICRNNKDIFINVLKDGTIDLCVDEDGNEQELAESESKYVRAKFENGECDSLYSWGR